ncbi:HAD family hydrolase [Streptomyces sp. RerS4]|uniref:HAD family hydrolase n=1 Tax=Streptomyces sp. RerS4 TaxID=2942449 RepID=UPI00201C03FF|nr:HAD family hydrolase [Streptomyces sp. RerS4]UQW99775.1 HAD family hydrolase [Streptomyces sp. RerS4]
MIAPSEPTASPFSAAPVELVIFDCDGVLVDTERIAARVQVTLGARFGWPLTEAEVISLFLGLSDASVREQVAARLGDAVALEWEESFRRLHAEAVDVGLSPVEGLPEALARITLPTCVASSGSHEKMRHTLGRTGLYEHFAGRIHSASEVPRGKPAPDLFLYAAARMGVDPAACVVVEDSPPGVEAARAAGMRSLGYAGGLTPAPALAGPGTTVFTDMRDLPALLGLAP